MKVVKVLQKPVLWGPSLDFFAILGKIWKNYSYKDPYKCARGVLSNFDYHYVDERVTNVIVNLIYEYCVDGIEKTETNKYPVFVGYVDAIILTSMKILGMQPT